MTPKRFGQNFGESYYETMPTLAEAMAQVLRWAGCKEIYGVGGDYVAPLVRGLTQSFELCPSSNETHASFSACAAAELAGCGFCLTTYTVGSMPALAGAALAMAERLPVIFLSGAPGEDEVHQPGQHHTLLRADSWSQSYDHALQAFRALGAPAERLQGARNPSQPNVAGEQFFKLVRHAMVRREPVLVEVPRDLVFEKTQTLGLSTTCPLQQTPGVLSALVGGDLIAGHIESRLRACSRPLVYIGEKVRLNHALRERILAFCERFNIPFSSSIYAKGVWGDDHPLNRGTYNGVFSLPETRAYVEHVADFVLEVGTSTVPQDMSSAMNTNTHALQYFANKVSLIGSSYVEADEIALFDLLLSRQLPRFDDVPHSTTVARRMPDAGVLGWDTITDTLTAVQTAQHRAFVYLPEVGSSLFGSFVLPTKSSQLGRSWLTNPWYGAMGTALPYARSVCRAIKRGKLSDVPIVLMGDGGFHFQSNELVHFQREGLDVVVVVVRNNCFAFGKVCDSPIYESQHCDFDLSSLVRAYGGKHWRSVDGHSLAQALGAAVEEERGIRVVEAVLTEGPRSESAMIRQFGIFIRAKAKDKEAMEAWDRLCATSAQG